MATQTIKRTNEALAFITLYKSMPVKVKEEVKEMIADEEHEGDSILFTSLSLQSWETENDLEDSKIWEKLYNERHAI